MPRQTVYPCPQPQKISENYAPKNKRQSARSPAFENFEGSAVSLEKRLGTTRHWVGIARKVDASYLQIPSHYKADESISDETLRISDLHRQR